MYDEQGTVDEEGEAVRGERDWREYWRLLFRKVSAGLGGAAGPAGGGSPPPRSCGRVSLTSAVRNTGVGRFHAVSDILLVNKSCYLRSVTSLLQITVKDIEDFEKSYKDSEEELADIKAAYMDFEGDMDRIMESVLCADYTDEPRIRKIIAKAIDSGEVPSYKGFVKESKQKMIARRRRVGCVNQGPKRSIIYDKLLISLGRNESNSFLGKFFLRTNSCS